MLAKKFIPVLLAAVAISPLGNAANPAPSPATATQPASKSKARNPLMMYALDLKQDDKKWILGNRFSTAGVLAMELVPEGQTHTSWKEMLTNMVIFDIPLRTYVDMWKSALSKNAPTISLTEEGGGEDTVIVRYKSADEQGIWRFVQGGDGVYAMSYQAKLEGLDQDRLGKWEGLVKQTQLTQNMRK